MGQKITRRTLIGFLRVKFLILADQQSGRVSTNLGICLPELGPWLIDSLGRLVKDEDAAFSAFIVLDVPGVDQTILPRSPTTSEQRVCDGFA